MSRFESVTVLTTEERSDWFKAVFGMEAHYVYDPSKTEPLGLYLSNLRIGHGSLVVLDEAHFPSADMLLMGVKSYVDDSHNMNGNMRLVVVCPGRKPGDRMLAYLTMYCQLFDIICAEDGIELISQLEQLVRMPNRRNDVLSYMTGNVQSQGSVMVAPIDRPAANGAMSSIEVPAGMRIRLIIEPVGA